MHRFGLVLMVITLAGCGALRDAFSAHADVAARAAGQTLTADRLAELAARGRRIPLSQNTLAAIAYVWVDYALLAAALAADEPLADSATVLAATGPLVSQLKWDKFHERLIAGRAALSEAQVDSAFAAGGARLFQHILLRAPAGSAADVERDKRTRIESLLRQVRAGSGATFARLARQFSDDPGSSARGGALGVSERDDPLVPEFQEAAWALEPGEVSGVVRSPYGFHVIRRPPLGEVRDSFRVGLETRLQARFDSVYLEDLARARRIAVKGDAPAVAREAVQTLATGWEDGRVLVRYRGGAFRVRDLVRWLHVLDPQYTQGFASAGDQQISEFLEFLTRRTILMRQADSAGVALEADEWAQIRAEHDSALALVQAALGLSARAIADSAGGGDARVRFAMARVWDYLERVLDNRAQFVPVPPFLAAELRERHAWDVSHAGLSQAVARAQAVRAATDSLTRGQNAPGVTPAPGPPPVPGGSGPGR